MTFTVWNTGRQYTEAGQRMAATILIDGKVAFFDADRGVWGITNEEFPGTEIKSWTMKQYDRGDYQDDYSGAAGIIDVFRFRDTMRLVALKQGKTD